MEGGRWKVEDGTEPHAMSVVDVLAAFGTTPDGLTEAEARSRLARAGGNMIRTAAPPGLLRIASRQFASPFVWLLLAAGLIALGLGEHADASILGITVAATVFFGFVQEAKAERALRELRRALTHEARVVRGGVERAIDARSLVPGDIVRTESGDMIPADVRILEASDAGADESALTGESLPIRKGRDAVGERAALAERTSMLWQGTVLVRGVTTGVVVATGLGTEYGKVVRSLAGVETEKTQFQLQMEALTAWIARLVIIVALVVGLAGALEGLPLYETLLIAIAVAVAAVPEGLPVTLTAVLALGMLHMFRLRALVRRLISVEALGSVSVLCVDKTGTLTEGHMALDRVSGQRDMLLSLAILGVGARVRNPDEPQDRWSTVGDPTERAVLDAALAEGGASVYRDRRIQTDIPFLAERRWRAAIGSADRVFGGERLLVVLGAPETILAASVTERDVAGTRPLRSERRTAIEHEIDSWAAEGIRTVALAVAAPGPWGLEPGARGAEHERLPPLSFVGLFGLSDPLRKDAVETIRRVRQAGVRVVMITGDTPATAASVAKAVGIDADEVHAWQEDGPSPEEAPALYRRVSVFARVPSADKLRIVRGMQQEGLVVAMTGDGVNDAPALTQADIGVVMGSGQDVARGAADLVLLDDNLGTIHRAIIEGRRVHANIRRIVVFLLYGSLIEGLLVLTALLGRQPLPILPAQILWVNLIEDVLPAFAFAFEPASPSLGRLPPRPRGEPLLSLPFRRFTLALGAGTSLFLLVLYALLLRAGAELAYVRTMMFVGVGIDVFFISLSLRSFRRPLVRTPFLGNRPLLFALGAGVLLYLVAIYQPALRTLLRTVPLGVGDWGVLLVFGSAHLVYAEWLKAAFFRGRQEEASA